jgi:hypothetical protein
MMRQKKNIYYYKWEFLRRNKQYQKDYDIYDAEKDLFKKEQLKYIIQERWGVTPANYRKNYLTLINPKWKGYLSGGLCFKQQFRLFNILQVDAWSEQSLEEKMGNPKKIEFKELVPTIISRETNPIQNFQEMKTLRLVLDLRYPKKTLLDRYEKTVSLYKRFVKNFPLNPSRRRVEDWEHYLEIYDLVQKKWSWDKLVKKYSKKKIGFVPYKNLVREVKRDYVAAEQIVNGGYGQLR